MAFKNASNSLQTPPSLSVGIIGTGYIADYHMQVLRGVPGINVDAAVDPNKIRLKEFCERWKISHGFSTLDEMVDSKRIDVVHVLTPPPTHFAVAKKSAFAGMHVLVEKPIVLSVSDCDALSEISESTQRTICVNHNAVYHPALQRLLKDVASRKLGQVEHIVSFNNFPLAQLASGQHDHWMFQAPQNILLEQATHPLSQICEILGPVVRAEGICTGQQKLKSGAIFHHTWQLSLIGEKGTAQVYLSWGRDFPTSTMTVVGRDGVANLDLDANAYTVDRRTKFHGALDALLRGVRVGRSRTSQAISEATRFATTTLKLTSRCDPYYRSMRDSIAAFYQYLTVPGTPYAGTLLKARTVSTAIEMSLSSAERAGTIDCQVSRESPSPKFVSSLHVQGEEPCVLVIGGTGFIGNHLVRLLEQTNRRVRVLVRRPEAAKAFRGSAKLEFVLGDVRDRSSLVDAMRGCQAVYLLTASAPHNWTGFYELFVQGTEHVIDVCMQHNVTQFLYVSTIGVFHLGSPHSTVTESTPLDRHPQARCHYSHAKILAEHRVRSLTEGKLNTLIFRPGLVIGPGSALTHLGVGEWPTPNQCISWGRSVRHPLPFVLVQDVAKALVLGLDRLDLAAQSFNLVGDIRPSAIEYLEMLGKVADRTILLHRQSIAGWTLIEWMKWTIKLMARREENTRLTYHELRYRTCRAQFDTGQTKQRLSWTPESNVHEFYRRSMLEAIDN